MRYLYFNTHMVIIGLGSNVGDRAAMLDKACEALSLILHDMRCSQRMETAALLPENAPAEWDIPFLNMAVCGTTTLSPQALCEKTQHIEQKLGRIKRGMWGPREIDIDILAMGETVFVSDNLTVPHKALLNRDFALKPLAELVPDWRYPVPGEWFGKTAREIATQ